MYSNYIFDLYGTLIDINTDESSNEFWYKLSLFYSFKGAVYIAEELKTTYENMVIKKTKANYKVILILNIPILLLNLFLVNYIKLKELLLQLILLMILLTFLEHYQ